MTLPGGSPTVGDLVVTALKTLPKKPPDSADREVKKRYSEQMSAHIAAALAEGLRQRGLEGARPSGPGELGLSGAERRMAGGIGAKKVDVTWATPESGLALAMSVKTINFKDGRTANFQKNVPNRRSDMLFEGVTLHRRFPYAVLVGFFCLDKGAALDQTEKRRSTFINAHNLLRIFTGRQDPAGRDEQYERLYVGLVTASPFDASLDLYTAGKPETPVALDQILNEVLEIVAERNPDFYEYVDGKVRRVGHSEPKSKPAKGPKAGKKKKNEPESGKLPL